MADKDTIHEAIGTGHQQQQQASYQMPPLTSKPLKQQQVLKDTTNQTESPSSPAGSGYYFNVAQKGKLILPTALWILLVLAGISFLTLLASLNRTVDTLDTLIELEQEREAHMHDVMHHQHRHHQLQHAESDSKEHEERQHDSSHPAHERPVGIQQQQDSGASNGMKEDRWLESMVPIKASWFSLPSWTSLERPQAQKSRPSEAAHDQEQALSDSGSSSWLPLSIASIIDDLMRQTSGSAQQADSERTKAMPEVSGSFIISSSSEAGQQQPTEMMDSIMKQMMSLFLPPEVEQATKSKSGQEAQSKASNKAPQQRFESQQPTTGSLITANVENLNINVNTGDDSADDEDASSTESNEKKAAADRRRVRPAADELDGAPPRVLMRHEHTRTPLVKMDLGLDDQFLPPAEVIRVGPFGTDNDRHHHQHRQPIDSPLASLMAPFGLDGAPFIKSLSGSSFGSGTPTSSMFAVQESSAASKQHNHLHHNKQGVQPEQTIISIASDDPTPFFAMNGDGGYSRGEGATADSRRNQAGSGGKQSPYELPVGSPISSLVDSLRDFDETVPSSGNDKQQQQAETFPSRRPLDEMQRLRENAKWDVLANDLADSLLTSVLRRDPAQQVDSGEMGQMLAQFPDMPQPAVLIKPLDQGERHKNLLFQKIFPGSAVESQDKGSAAKSEVGITEQSASTSSSTTSKPEEESGFGDLFSFLFKQPAKMTTTTTAGSVPSVEQPTTPPIATSENDSLATIETLIKELRAKLGEPFSQAPATDSIGDGSGSQPQTKEPISEILTASLEPKKTSVSDQNAESSTKEAASDSGNESALNDILGSMFTLAQFGGDQQQRNTGESGGSSSSSSVETTSTTPTSIVTQKATTTTTETVRSSITTESSTDIPEPLRATLMMLPNNTATGAPADLQTTGAGDLQKNPLLKGFLGVGQSEPFFPREDSPAPIASSTPELVSPIVSSAAPTVDADRTITTTPTTTTTAATSSSVPPSTSAESPSTGSDVATTTIGSTTTRTEETSQSLTSQRPTTFAEVIREDEAPANIPVIDLAPYAKSSPPIESDTKKTAANVGGSTSPILTSTELPTPSTTGADSSKPADTTTQQTSTTANSSSSSNKDTNNMTISSLAGKMDTASTNTTTTTTPTTATNTSTTTPHSGAAANQATGRPPKSLLERADEFLGRNLQHVFKKLF